MTHWHNQLLPAILGQKTERPLRPVVIQHSADGVFTIREGPWTWVEGKPAGALKPEIEKTHGDWFKPQLYNLKEDPAQTEDVSAKYPESFILTLLDSRQ